MIDNKPNGGFDVGGVGSERECILDVGDVAKLREDAEIGVRGERRESCGGREAVGRGGTEGGIFWGCWPCGK
jgi:hypothetical protein